MICNSCKKNEAVVYYKTTIQNHTDEQYLCKDCAKAMQIPMKMPSLQKLFSGTDPFNSETYHWWNFFNETGTVTDIWRDMFSDLDEQVDLIPEEFVFEGDSTLDSAEFMIEGRDVVKHIDKTHEVDPSSNKDKTFFAIEGRNTEFEHNTMEDKADTNNELSLEQLQANLAEAVRQENYSEAAKLRDMIQQQEDKGEA